MCVCVYIYIYTHIYGCVMLTVYIIYMIKPRAGYKPRTGMRWKGVGKATMWSYAKTRAKRVELCKDVCQKGGVMQRRVRKGWSYAKTCAKRVELCKDVCQKGGVVHLLLSGALLRVPSEFLLRRAVANRRSPLAS